MNRRRFTAPDQPLLAPDGAPDNGQRATSKAGEVRLNAFGGTFWWEYSSFRHASATGRPAALLRTDTSAFPLAEIGR